MPADNEQFCKSWGEVQNSTFVLLSNSCAKLNFSASISQPSQSCKTVGSNGNGRHYQDQTDRKNEQTMTQDKDLIFAQHTFFC
ncbi:MAG: hypothetical protein JSS64_07315, partial [Bacteroidetes bacterium]|nr:hypothetical protein [Bacteroidota bacterium]